MTPEEIRARIRTHIEASFPEKSAELTDETELLEERFLDSLAIVETVVFLERTFAIKMSQADLNQDNFRSIQALARFVASRRDA